MSDETFENVTISARPNVYFDGDVVSRDVVTADGERKTLGIMRPGDYTFETEDEEVVELYAGTLVASVPDRGDEAYEAGDTFTVPPDTSFDVAVDEFVEYCCTYR